MRKLSFFLFSLILLSVGKVQSTELEIHEVKYYDEFVNFIENFNSNGRDIIVYFYGEKNNTGYSFCSDCQDAEPYVKEALETYGDNKVFVAVNIGNGTMWKDKQNSFRTDKRTNLTAIPTLIRWTNKTITIDDRILVEGDLTVKSNYEWFFFFQEKFLAPDSTDKVNKYHVNYFEGFEYFKKYFSRYDRTLFYFFYGEKDDSGISFCPYCVSAEPIVQQALENQDEDVVLVLVNVGNEAMWNDPENGFKTYQLTNLTYIPTMIRWDGSEKTLVGDDFKDPEALEWILE